MTNTEILCTFMEPNAPENGGVPNVDFLKKFSPFGWWRYSGLSCNWKQPILDNCDQRLLLGLLWEIEERLTDEQWEDYRKTFDPGLVRWFKDYMHATPEQKIQALAAVLGPLVEQGERT